MANGELIFTDKPTTNAPGWDNTKWGGHAAGDNNIRGVSSSGVFTPGVRGVWAEAGYVGIGTSPPAPGRELTLNITPPSPSDPRWKQGRRFKGVSGIPAQEYTQMFFGVYMALDTYPTLLITRDWVYLCDYPNSFRTNASDSYPGVSGNRFSPNYDGRNGFPPPYDQLDDQYLPRISGGASNTYYGRVANDGSAFNFKLSLVGEYPVGTFSNLLSYINRRAVAAKIWRGTEPGWQKTPSGYYGSGTTGSTPYTPKFYYFGAHMTAPLTVNSISLVEGTYFYDPTAPSPYTHLYTLTSPVAVSRPGTWAIGTGDYA